MKQIGSEELLNLNKLPIIENRKISISKMCRGKSVITIGCVSMIEVIEDYKAHINSENFQLYNLNKYCKNVIGIDVNQEGINKLKKYGYKNVYKYDIFTDQIDEIDNKEYDVLILSHVIEHVPDMYNFLKKTIEKFKFKKIIVAVPSSYDFGPVMKLVLKKQEVISNDHYYTFSPVTLKKLLESLDIQTEKIYIDREKNPKLINKHKNIFRRYIGKMV
ncbi:hypothetical protein AN644_03210, partial [Candidatus Epulonipiscium fishelsonii]